MENEIFADQNVSLFARKRIELTGITDVTSFTESSVEAEYSGGMIAVEGEELKIEEFSSESGRLTVCGTVNGFFYFGRARKNKRGFFGK